MPETNLGAAKKGISSRSIIAATRGLTDPLED